MMMKTKDNYMYKKRDKYTVLQIDLPLIMDDEKGM